METSPIKPMSSVALLEPYQYSASEHPTLRVESQAALFSAHSRLETKEVSGVHDSLSVKRQTEVWKGLGNKDVQARVVDREPSLERIDRKYGCLR